MTGVVAAPDPDVPTVVHLTWDLFSAPGENWVEYGEGTLDQESPHAPAGNTATLLGLKAGHTYQYRVVVQTEGGDRLASAIGELGLAAPPPELPAFITTTEVQSAVEPGGFVLTSLLQDGASWIVVLDRDGDYVWYLPSDEGMTVPGVRLDADGTGLVYLQSGNVSDSGVRGVVHQPFDGGPRTVSWVDDAHHDAVQLPDGRMAFLREYAVADVELEDGERVDLANDEIVAVPEGAGSEAEAEVLFSFLDDYGHPPWRTCDHFDGNSLGGGKDWVHANSLMVDEAGASLLVMSKNLDALVAVPLGGGRPLWQAGGRFGDLVDVDGDTLDPDAAAEVDGPNGTWWSHGHMSHAWDGGFLVFDNGYHHDPTVSRVVEYTFDPDAGTLQKTWEFTSETRQFLPLLGDAQKLPSGNVLISWTLQGLLTEVTPDGEVAWRAEAELGAGTSRVRWLPDLYGGR